MASAPGSLPPPLVTAFLTVHSRTEYFPAAVESALAQTYPSLEILVVNDGGPPEIDVILARYPDPRLRHLRHPQNRGLPETFQPAFAAARGEFFTFLNDDDVWEPEFVAKLMAELLADHALVLAFSDHAIIDPSGRLDPAAGEANTRTWGRAALAAGRQQPFYDLAVHGTIPVAMASIFRRDAVDWQNFPAIIGPSWDLWLGCLAARGDRAASYLPERLTRYRVHENSQTSRSRVVRCRGNIFIIEKLLADPQFASCAPTLRHQLADTNAQLGYQWLQDGQPRDARRCLQIAWKTERRPKVAAALLLTWFPAPVLRWLKQLLPKRRPHRADSPAIE